MKKIIVIEDSPTQAAHIRLLLERNGFSALVVNNGESGVALCLSDRPDAVITDVIMPGIDGYEVTRRLKADPQTNKIPVIVMTTLDDPSHVLKAVAAGADNYITKPIRESHVVDRVKRAVCPLPTRSDVPTPTPAVVDVLTSSLEDAVARKDDLRRKQEELTQTNAQREESMRVVAHELRGPLQTLTMRAMAARTMPESRELLEVLPELIERQVRSMRRIIDDLTDLTDLDLGRLRLEKVDASFKLTVSSIIEDFQISHPDRQIRFECSDPLHAKFDPARVQQVVVNFLGNALKYSIPDGAITGRASGHDKYIEFTLSDEGPGIGEEYLSHIFDRYYRGSAVKTKVVGTGLGLYICRCIIELHGGTVGVRSTVGRGSTFWFRLPWV